MLALFGKQSIPLVFRDISLEFVVQGDVDPAAVWRALQLSEERLCPVWNMLKSSTSIRAVFRLEKLDGGFAHPLSQRPSISLPSGICWQVWHQYVTRA